MRNTDWTYLAVASDGEPLEIGGTDVWWHEWQRLEIGTLDVAHPSYPDQTHRLWPYAIESDSGPLIFCAGELSNALWCFHVPVSGQPAQMHKGATVNERLVLTGWLDPFDAAIEDRSAKRAEDILIATGLLRQQASDTVAVILDDPRKYGFDG